MNNLASVQCVENPVRLLLSAVIAQAAKDILDGDKIPSDWCCKDGEYTPAKTWLAQSGLLLVEYFDIPVDLVGWARENCVDGIAQ